MRLLRKSVPQSATTTAPDPAMTTYELLHLLRAHPSHHLRFLLPDGGMIQPHAHITEVGRVDKTFLDCGGTVRKTSFLCLQAWVADDLDHRLPAGKLAEIIERATPILGADDLPVELEYEDGLLSQFPVTGARAEGDVLLFALSAKHTDCLAKELCLPPAPAGDSGCCGGTGCC